MNSPSSHPGPSLFPPSPLVPLKPSVPLQIILYVQNPFSSPPVLCTSSSSLWVLLMSPKLHVLCQVLRSTMSPPQVIIVLKPSTGHLPDASIPCESLFKWSSPVQVHFGLLRVIFQVLLLSPKSSSHSFSSLSITVRSSSPSTSSSSMSCFMGSQFT